MKSQAITGIMTGNTAPLKKGKAGGQPDMSWPRPADTAQGEGMA